MSLAAGDCGGDGALLARLRTRLAPCGAVNGDLTRANAAHAAMDLHRKAMQDAQSGSAYCATPRGRTASTAASAVATGCNLSSLASSHANDAEEPAARPVTARRHTGVGLFFGCVHSRCRDSRGSRGSPRRRAI